jgi:hypothetical protein
MGRMGVLGEGRGIKEGDKGLPTLGFFSLAIRGFQNDRILTLKRNYRPQAAFKALRLIRGD